ncbi:hypothetical protein D3C75_1049580 [compost metagenome]
MAEAEKAVGIAFCGIIVIQPYRVHHPLEVAIVGNAHERLHKQQIDDQADACEAGEVFCSEQSFHILSLPLRKQLHIFIR